MDAAQRVQKIYELLGQLYVENYNNTQMLSHLQHMLVQKDDKIKELEGSLLDIQANVKADDVGTPEV